MEVQILGVLFLILNSVLSLNAPNFLLNDEISFGVATSAYQIEGAWNVSGKGISLWDYITHNTELVVDGSTGDIACNSYYKVDEDIKLLKALGVNHYRFSISWTRILPTGMVNDVNYEGLAYYDMLISKLLEAEIEPWVTIYHFDHPYSINLLGGWFQPLMVDYIRDYADFLFYHFGNRVKTWLTINEPYSLCVSAITSTTNLYPKGQAEYICGHNVLLAHAAIYEVYDKKYRASQKGKLSMAFNLQAYWPATNKQEDIDAAERMNQFAFGWFVHPIVYGNYPQIMIDIIGHYSQEQGFTNSRLPGFSLVDGLRIKGSYDFIGLNNYDTFLVSANNSTINKIPSFFNDVGADYYLNTTWNQTYDIEMKAKGLGTILKWIKETYSDPEIKITEQGYPDDTGELVDFHRHFYLLSNLIQLSKSINEDKVNVTGYTFWSFIDNFEWLFGYTKKYGLLHVDFNDTDRPRELKMSAVTYSLLAKSRNLKNIL